MTPKQPPVVATWLLRHLGSSPNNDAVLGDHERLDRDQHQPDHLQGTTTPIGYLAHAT